VPIAVSAGMDPLQYEVLFVIAMGLGTFAPPMGVGLFSTCLICDTTVGAVSRKIIRYWVVIAAACILLILVPEITLWLPHMFGPKAVP
jgi:TRAP-type C4-dicarboxylate transport system permease large subunit